MEKTMKIVKRRFVPSVTSLEQRNLLSLTLTQLAQYQGTTPWFEAKDDTADAIGHLTIDWGDGNGISNAPGDNQTWINYWGATYDYLGLNTHFYPNPGVYTITLHAWDDHGGDQTLNVTADTRPPVPAQLFLDGQGYLGGPVHDVIGDQFTVSPIAASNKTIATVDWSIQNISNGVADVIASQQVTQLNGFENTPWGVNGREDGDAPLPVTAYWGQYGGTESISAVFHYTDGTVDFVNQNVQVDVPTSSLTATHLGTVSLNTSGSTYAISAGAGAGDPGFGWSMDVATTDGILFNIGTVQVIDSATATETYSTSLGTKWRRDYFRDPNTDAVVTPLLDNYPGGTTSVFYAADIGTSGVTERTSDTPGMGFVPATRSFPGVLTVSMAMQFTDTLMVQPTMGQVGPGIYVPVCKQTWAWAATWDQKHPTRIATATNPSLVLANTPTTSYPIWDDLGTYYAGTPNPRYYEVQIA